MDISYLITSVGSFFSTGFGSTGLGSSFLSSYLSSFLSLFSSSILASYFGSTFSGSLTSFTGFLYLAFIYITTIKSPSL